MTNKQKSIEWWNSLSFDAKENYLKRCQDKDIVSMFVTVDNITGRLIETIYEEISDE